MPTFNRLEFVPPAIESVFAQSLTDWELIIADDGSGTDTRALGTLLVNAPRFWRSLRWWIGAMRTTARALAPGAMIGLARARRTGAQASRGAPQA